MFHFHVDLFFAFRIINVQLVERPIPAIQSCSNSNFLGTKKKKKREKNLKQLRMRSCHFGQWNKIEEIYNKQCKHLAAMQRKSCLLYIHDFLSKNHFQNCVQREKNHNISIWRARLLFFDIFSISNLSTSNSNLNLSLMLFKVL